MCRELRTLPICSIASLQLNVGLGGVSGVVQRYKICTNQRMGQRLSFVSEEVTNAGETHFSSMGWSSGSVLRLSA